MIEKWRENEPQVPMLVPTHSNNNKNINKNK
jgi:hypothetical protein